MAQQTPNPQTAVGRREDRGIIIEGERQYQLAMALNKNMKTIMAFGGTVEGEDGERTARKVIASILLACTENPDLLEADQTSLILSALRAVRMGLDPSGTLGSAYLVPYKKKGHPRPIVQLIPGYRGLIDKAIECGAATKIWAETYCEADHWEYQEGTDPYIKHQKFLRGPRGPFIAAYACAKVGIGDVQFTVIPAFEMENFTRESLPWKENFLEMAKKTAVRRLVKTLALNPDRHSRLAEILVLDDRADQGLIHRDDEETLTRLYQSKEPENTPQARAKAALRAQPVQSQGSYIEEEQPTEGKQETPPAGTTDPVKVAVIQAYGLAPTMEAWREVGKGVPEALQGDPDISRAKNDNKNRIIKAMSNRHGSAAQNNTEE